MIIRATLFPLPRLKPHCYSCRTMQAWENNKNLHVLRLAGEIDLNTSRELRARLQHHVKAKSPALVLDFSEVRYIDSSGLATIVEYVQQARAFEGRIALAQVSDRVRTIFELVRLHEFIPIHPTVAEAAAALGSGPST